MEVLNFIKNIPNTILGKSKSNKNIKSDLDYEIDFQTQISTILQGKEILDLSYNAYNQYRDHVRGKQDITFEQAKRYLTRNVLLGNKYLPYKVIANQVTYKYGNLYIYINTRKNEIVYIENFCDGFCSDIKNVDKGYKEFLNKKFEIE